MAAMRVWVVEGIIVLLIGCFGLEKKGRMR